MEFIKKNITLILGLSIPVLMILFVAGSIYLPGLFVQPKINFLYVSGSNSYYYGNGWQYGIQEGRIIKNGVSQPIDGYYDPMPSGAKLFIYDVVKNESREIFFQEAQNLSINSNNISEDGFEITYGNRGDSFFPFYYSGTDYNTRYIVGHNVSKKLNLQLSGSYYDFRFLGWIQ